MDSLNQIHFLYQYSLKFFLDIFSSVLYSNKKLSGVTDYGARLAIITRDLFGVSTVGLLCSVYIAVDCAEYQLWVTLNTD